MRNLTPVEIGREYGQLTLLSQASNDSYGHHQFNVRCRCGNEFIIQKSNLLKGASKCLECSRKYDSARRRIPIIGQTINGWTVLSEAGKNRNGALLFNCVCCNCGTTTIKTRASLSEGKETGCVHCPPQYGFAVEGGVATGHLPDGSVFLIDAADIPQVSKLYWHKAVNGYIVCQTRGRTKIRLHRYLLGLTEDADYIVDHINREKLDCRKANLRVVTAQQNAMNRSIQKNNRSGYVGVYYIRRKQKYGAKIGLNDKNIYLGYTFDTVEGAQMYNVASDILFGEFAGHRNNVPPPSKELISRMEAKCRPYLSQAIEATRTMSGIFLSA